MKINIKKLKNFRYFEQEIDSFNSSSTLLTSVPSKSSTATDHGERFDSKPTTSVKPSFSCPSLSECLEFANRDRDKGKKPNERYRSYFVS